MTYDIIACGEVALDKNRLPSDFNVDCHCKLSLPVQGPGELEGANRVVMAAQVAVSVGVFNNRSQRQKENCSSTLPVLSLSN